MTAPMTREELLAVLGPFYKTVDVMKSVRNSTNMMMSVWADDMKAVEDVMFFLENLRDHGNAQAPSLTDAMVEAGARVVALRRGHKSCDELVMTTNAGKQPVWKFYTEEPRAILEAVFNAAPPSNQGASK